MNVILFTGRLTAWQYCVDDIETHIIKVIGKSLIFVSGHIDENSKMDSLEFIERVKPEVYSLECYKPSEEHINNKILNGHNDSPMSSIRYVSMFYHNEKAFSLLEEYMKINNIKESDIGWVFKIRADFKPLEDIILPNISEPNIIYIPESKKHYKPCPCNCIPDQVAAGSFDTMKKYCSLYSRIFIENLNLDIPERTLYHHICNKGLTWTWAPCEYLIDGRRFHTDSLHEGDDIRYKNLIKKGVEDMLLI
jgi:hypothetical protein